MSAAYFTTKVAYHHAFCDRITERQMLANSISKNQHTVIVAPRRYGKTSLAMKVLSDCGYLFSTVDLFCVVYEEDICQKVAAAISALIKSIASFSEKAIKLIEQCFKTASIGIKAGHIELIVDLSKSRESPIHKLEDLLLGLELLASKHKKNLVLFFDEFQDVLKIDQSNKIQAAIRSVAQHSQYVTYIFSGSSRKMLTKIFEDRNQPLYMLCHKILLARISKNDFKIHIQKAAKSRWKKHLSNDILTKIFDLTQCHPYYVNLLCGKLWDQKNYPNVKNVVEAWEQCLFENKGKIISDLEPLNTNRMKVLTTIAAFGTVNAPNSKAFLDQVKLPLSSTQHAVQYLLEHDYLYKTKNGLAIVDPLMQLFILNR